MKLYKYELISNIVTITSVLEVKQNKSTYSLITSPNKRIQFSKIGKVLSDEEMILYLTEDNIQQATMLFSEALLNQASAYLHTVDSIFKTVKKLGRNNVNVKNTQENHE